VLGAFYGIKKEWYRYIGGFELHRSWGGLEPYISLKSWFFGGECRTAPLVEVAHLFKASGTHSTALHHIQYNKMLIARLLFNDHHYDRMVKYLGSDPNITGGKKMLKENWKAIESKRKEYAKKIVISPEAWCERWQTDFRLD